MNDRTRIAWPPKLNVLGVGVSATTYDELLGTIIQAASQGTSAIVDHMCVHGLVTAGRDPDFIAVMNGFDVVAPDGQPVRWALNLLHKAGLSDRVYGPELMLRICRRVAETGRGVYLYGGQPQVVEKLRSSLEGRFPSLKVVGCESPPFRPLTQKEDAAMVERINNSGADIVFLGLGCPLQEKFAYEHKGRIRGIQICVGAAFDFHAGTKKMAPKWMQRHALEWLFRLLQEPRRLGRRYFVTNTIFLARLGLQLSGLRNYPRPT
jgi:exopolysaccharide biosynthesis WecB/TagA/CpsF family protein